MTEKQPKPQQEGFNFTDNETLFYKVNHERFKQMIFDDNTTIHKVQIDSNNYGEFLFLTASRPTPQGKECITYFGLGLHEHRDRWLADRRRGANRRGRRGD